MSKNVSEVIESRNSTLFEKLASNNDLSNVIMGFLGRIVLMCQQTGKPIEGVETTMVNEYDGDFRFGIVFHDIFISPMGIWQGQGDVVNYARSKSVHLAKVLERNAGIIRTFTNLVEVVEGFCDRKGIRFSEFTVRKAIIHQGSNTCVIRYGKPTLKDGRR